MRSRAPPEILRAATHHLHRELITPAALFAIDGSPGMWKIIFLISHSFSLFLLFFVGFPFFFMFLYFSLFFRGVFFKLDVLFGQLSVNLLDKCSRKNN